MNQSQVIRVPAPLHAQLKALAAHRGNTMVGVLHELVRRAIVDDGLSNDVPGFSVRLLLDMDAEDHGPFVSITTPKGVLPRMTRDDARAVADALEQIEAQSEVVRKHRKGAAGRWSVENAGTGVKLTGTPADGKAPIEAVFNVAFARDFARQLRRDAEQAAPAHS